MFKHGELDKTIFPISIVIVWVAQYYGYSLRYSISAQTFISLMLDQRMKVVYYIYKKNPFDTTLTITIVACTNN